MQACSLPQDVVHSGKCWHIQVDSGLTKTSKDSKIKCQNQRVLGFLYHTTLCFSVLIFPIVPHGDEAAALV